MQRSSSAAVALLFCIVAACVLLLPPLALAQTCSTVTCDPGSKGNGGDFDNCTSDCINGAVCPKGQQVCGFEQCYNASLSVCYADSVLCDISQAYCSPSTSTRGACYNSATQTCQRGVVCSRGFGVCLGKCFAPSTEACTIVGVCPKGAGICKAHPKAPGGCIRKNETCIQGRVCPKNAVGVCDQGDNGQGGCLTKDKKCVGGLICNSRDIVCGNDKLARCFNFAQTGLGCKNNGLVCGSSVYLNSCINPVTGSATICSNLNSCQQVSSVLCQRGQICGKSNNKLVCAPLKAKCTTNGQIR